MARLTDTIETRIEVKTDRVVGHVIIGSRVETVLDEKINSVERDHLIRTYKAKLVIEEYELHLKVAR